jgi:hypothetical protein
VPSRFAYDESGGGGGMIPSMLCRIAVFPYLGGRGYPCHHSCIHVEDRPILGSLP